jgi:glycosyltransferase involved in cell wall biosynthesis
MDPKLSVAVCAYNVPRELPRTIHSLSPSVDNFNNIVAQAEKIHYSDVQDDLNAVLNIVPNNWRKVERRSHAQGILCSDQVTRQALGG